MKNLKYVGLGLIIVFISLFFAKAEDANSTKAVLSAYESVRAALAKDDLVAAKAATNNLIKSAIAGKNESIEQHAKKLVSSDSIEKAREHFKAISIEAIKIISSKDGYYVMTCPMANADWIQTNKNVENPYMGQKMSGCGSIKTSTQSSKVSTGCSGCST